MAAVKTIDQLKRELSTTSSSAKDHRRQALELELLWEEQKDDAGREAVKALIESKHPECKPFLPAIFGAGATAAATTEEPLKGLPSGAVVENHTETFAVVYSGGNQLRLWQKVGDKYSDTHVGWVDSTAYGADLRRAKMDLDTCCQRKLDADTDDGGAMKKFGRWVTTGSTKPKP
jgi:hypothetical protein